MGLNTYWARELPCLVLVPRLLLCTSEVMDMRKFILFSSVSRDFFFNFLFDFLVDRFIQKYLFYVSSIFMVSLVFSIFSK